jgi:hypothetical protein
MSKRGGEQPLTSVRPCGLRDDGGWQLRVSWGSMLFWYHPSKRAKQWETPAEVQPALWRECVEKDGTVTFCNMETEERQGEHRVVSCTET